MTSAPGLELAAIAGWMDRELPGVSTGELSATVLAGGKSNLTYRLTDGRSAWALRRPPLGHVLPTAHDMAREFRIITALRDTAVPVPGAVALCEDHTVLGAPFYLMAFVDGVVVDNGGALDDVTPATARRISEVLLDALLALHEQQPTALGLADFGRPEGFLERQVRRWGQQWEKSQTRPLDSLNRAVGLLSAAMPISETPAIVHGDYRLGNTIFAHGLDKIEAVIDWEMATLGDPLTDLALLIVYQTLAENGEAGLAPLRGADGFLTVDELAQRYAQGSHRSLERLNWYVGFAYFKLAVISEGIRYRHLAGQTVGEGFDQVGDSVPALLQAALDSLAADASH